MKAGKKISLRVLALVLVSLSGVWVFAQEQPGQPNPPQQQQTTEDITKRPGFGRQLARQTNEAAGENNEEKDDKAVFKQSGSVRFIAKKLGISTGAASLLSFLFNFAVIAGIILWAAGKHLPGVFRARTAAIQKAMQEAQKAGEEARRKLVEIEARLLRLDVEIANMRTNAEKEAELEEARIKAATQEDARKIVEAAQHEIAAAAKTARRALSAYAADLAVGLAQKQIHVDAATDQALVRNFAGNLGAGDRDAPRKDRN
jgi:F-type H+-transporting ATPase subunit b